MSVRVRKDNSTRRFTIEQCIAPETVDLIVSLAGKEVFKLNLAIGPIESRATLEIEDTVTAYL